MGCGEKSYSYAHVSYDGVVRSTIIDKWVEWHTGHAEVSVMNYGSGVRARNAGNILLLM